MALWLNAKADSRACLSLEGAGCSIDATGPFKLISAMGS